MTNAERVAALRLMGEYHAAQCVVDAHQSFMQQERKKDRAAARSMKTFRARMMELGID
jgi:hypothetical protein